jgi:hypothetical protein
LGRGEKCFLFFYSLKKNVKEMSPTSTQTKRRPHTGKKETKRK